jgi:glycosyltransferase involved in cell wall biosynthesis
MDLLALVEAPDHVCCRYRIRAFAPSLRAIGADLTIQALSRSLAGRLTQLTRSARFDTTILQRKLLPRWQVRMLRRRARHLVFDFDDAVLYRDSYDLRGPHCSRRAARFAAIVQVADTVIAGNDFLADCAVRSGARPERVRVIPTCIDIHRYPPPDHSGSEPRPLEERDAGLDLVWIGSSSTLQGLERRRGLWERIGRELPGVRLRVICDRFPEFGPLPVLAVPWSGENEADALAAGDVGISWIPDDLWSRGKCGLKVLQYQASGLPVLANPVGVHPALIEHGRTGWLADTPESWLAGVRALAADPARQRRMGEAARAAVAARYSVEAWAPRVIEAVTGKGSKGRPGVGTGAGAGAGIGRGRVRPTADGRNSPQDSRPLDGVGNGRVEHS